jgi:nucleoid DNA-binding protein
MTHSQLIREIARRLPRLKRRDIAEVLAVQHELWLADLTRPDASITLGDLGKLVVEVQQMQAGGVVGRRRLKRLYLRFRPTAKLKAAILGMGNGHAE